EKNNRVFVSMPGVPHEMKYMMTHMVIPKLLEKFRTPAIHHTVIRTVGIGESVLAEKIAAWENALPAHIRLAYLPSLGEVKLRLTALGKDKEELLKESNILVDNLKLIAGDYIYGVGEDSLQLVVGNALRQRKLTLSAAESCTGGYVSHLITSVPGSSDYFIGSVIAYANDVKIKELGVLPPTLADHGAVSEETVVAMAQAVRKKFGTSIGVATSGIAGPGGGTAGKPVGTVWIAYADERQTVTRKLQLSKDRTINIHMSSVATLNLIRIHMPVSEHSK
ncbi:MAG TPA: nicotinamide-nucleotide amidohydrolase family protein, partial [Chryseosolibacter sp.]|nr:nicotinamide-nucleotide amidohydrolase family protein [Chryseosolibacter sp.]